MKVRSSQARGTVLLEVLLALALFVAVAMSVLGLIDRVIQAAIDARRTEYAADLARSAMSRLEAGLATPETLSGPVRLDTGDGDVIDPPEPWEVEVQTSPSPFADLSVVSVRAWLPGAGDSVQAEFTVEGLVRLVRSVPETPQTDPLVEMFVPEEAPAP
jgi:Tfp pilus assembly protein PilV